MAQLLRLHIGARQNGPPFSSRRDLVKLEGSKGFRQATPERPEWDDACTAKGSPRPSQIDGDRFQSCDRLLFWRRRIIRRSLTSLDYPLFQR
jgi:hypothetical protein